MTIQQDERKFSARGDSSQSSASNAFSAIDSRRHRDALDIEAALFVRRITPPCVEMRAAVEQVS